MGGVLVSAQTLRGEKAPSNRYPTLSDARRRLEEMESWAWPVVHYHTRARGEALKQEIKTLRDSCEALRGIQLNVARPEREMLRALRESGIEIILHVNRDSLQTRTAAEIANYVAQYVDCADHALVDFSGGAGITLDCRLAVDALKVWPARTLRPGLAGGLNGECRENLARITLEWGRRLEGVSVDAEANLRLNGVLDRARCARYGVNVALALAATPSEAARRLTAPEARTAAT
jgi:phosphoribosylanthranilate isomerase